MVKVHESHARIMPEKLRPDGGRTNEGIFAATVGRVQVGHRTTDREVFIRQRNSTFIAQTRPNNSKTPNALTTFETAETGEGQILSFHGSVLLGFAVALARGRICIPSMWGSM